jgi:hypothetical protein
MLQRLERLTLAGLVLVASVPAWAGEVKVSFSNGLVTVVATDASPRQILTEWAKLGQVRITNLERLGGGPVTLQLKDVPEAQALETLLRGTAGFVAAPRPAAASTGGASRYDRILLMPGVAPAVPAAAASSTTPAQPMNRGRIPAPTFDTTDDDDVPEPVRMPGPNGVPPRGGPGGGPFQGFVPGQTLTPGQSVSPGQFSPPGAGGQQGTAPPAQAGAQVPSRQIIAYPNPQLPPGATPAVPGMATPLPSQSAPGMPTPFPSLSAVPMPSPDDATFQAPGVQGQMPGMPMPQTPNPGSTPMPAMTTPGSPTPGAATPGTITPGAPTPTGPVKKGPGGKG